MNSVHEDVKDLNDRYSKAQHKYFPPQSDWRISISQNRVGEYLLRLGREFIVPQLVLERGHNFCPVLGGGLLPCGFPGVETMILVSPLDTSSISVDNANSLGGIVDPLCPCTLIIILIDLGPDLPSTNSLVTYCGMGQL
jgi:hypothetical protein